MEDDTPPPSTWPAPATPHATPPNAVRSWEPPRLSAAGWLAASGASLLLIAAIIVVTSSWQSIDPGVRFAGLVGSLVAVYFAAEAGRRRLPSTSRSLAALAATLTAPVGVAAAATLGQPWPVCTLVGGVAALAATEMQSRRWNVPELKAATVVAFGLAAVGASVLTSVPVSVIGAAGAALALLLGSVRRSVTLAVAVGLSPVLAALSAEGFAPGTLARLGTTGDGLVWSAPLSCTIAAVVIAVVAQRRSNQPLAVVALATFASGLLTGLLVGAAGPHVWWSIPAILLLAVEASGAAPTDSIWRRIARAMEAPLALGLAAVAVLLPYGVLWSYWLDDLAGSGDLRSALPVGLTALGLLATSVGSSRRATGRWSTEALVAALGAGFAALVVGGAPLWIAALAAVAAWMAVTATTPWGSWDATTATIASWMILAGLLDDAMPLWTRATLVIAAGVAVVVSVSFVQRADEGFRLITAAAVVALASALVGSDEPIVFATTAFAALIALGVALRPDRSLWPLAMLSLIWLATVDDAPAEWTSVVLTGIVALAFASSSRRLTDIRVHLAAALATVTGALALATGGVDPGTATMAGVLVGTAFSGIALLDRRYAAALTAGVTATAIAVVASSLASPVFASIAWTMLGAQTALAGGVWRGRLAAVPGAAIAVLASCSIWWTTGANSAVIAAIEPYGATGVDLVVGVLIVSLLAIGWVARRVHPIGSWLAYGPALAFAGTWLLASQLEPHADWATIGALGIGITTLGIGGWQRLGAPLVAGTIMIGGTLLLSAGPRLAATPTWSWIAVGGVGLLALAALIERTETPLLPIGRRAQTRRSLLEQFCEQFN